jgi:hypothetical protein
MRKKILNFLKKKLKNNPYNEFLFGDDNSTDKTRMK